MLMFKKEEGKLISLRYCAKPFPLQWEIPRIRGAWQSAVHGVTRVRHNLVTKQEGPPPPLYSRYYFHFIHERNREVKLQVITQILSVRVRIESYKLSIHSRSFPFPVSVTA